jgi:hypothetical protein
MEIHRNVYGDRKRYAIVETPDDGHVGPAYFDNLPWLGTAHDVFTLINLSGLRQDDIAQLIGTSQQSVSRWIRAATFPPLTPEQWQLTVNLYLDRVVERS